jgi:hypothetical protein
MTPDKQISKGPAVVRIPFLIARMHFRRINGTFCDASHQQENNTATLFSTDSFNLSFETVMRQ